MSTPIAKIPKPEASKYDGKRKLILVPLLLTNPDTSGEGENLLKTYWSDVRNHIHNLEKSLGTVSHIYHEAISENGEEGLKIIEAINPIGGSLITELSKSTAKVESTDDKSVLEESTDWQRCLSIGLVSANVMNTIMDLYRKSIDNRYDHINNQINNTLKDSEVGVLFIREDHKVQFSSDIQVFYVSPPSLDPVKKWLQEQFLEAQKRFEQAQQKAEEQTGKSTETSDVESTEESVKQSTDDSS
ncbi:MAG: hypothetical protein QGE99_06095 [SAR202 cluster bacterium]|nr:hypothetical protein [SAR202 cluster bacterium]